jgi:hypothetical protein
MKLIPQSAGACGNWLTNITSAGRLSKKRDDPLTAVVLRPRRPKAGSLPSWSHWKEDVMKHAKNTTTVFKFCFSALLVVSMVACAGGFDTWRGRTSHEKDRIALHDGSDQGIWKTDDLVVRYNYSLSSNDMHITGNAALSQMLQDRADAVKRFTLAVNFLDAQGKDIETRELAAAGYKEEAMSWTFEHRFALPAGTAAMAFSYDGEMSQGSGGGSGEGFWYDPFLK